MKDHGKIAVMIAGSLALAACGGQPETSTSGSKILAIPAAEQSSSASAKASAPPTTDQSRRVQQSGAASKPVRSLHAGRSSHLIAPPAGVARLHASKPRREALPRRYRDTVRDKFESTIENAIKLVLEQPVSTFSVDVDTASYGFMRRTLNSGTLPPKDTVRLEELINYFDYGYPQPKSPNRPFQPTVTVAPSPWREGNKLIHIGIKGYDLEAADKPRSNLVFLLDVSGSMNAPDKLPLMVNSMKLLLESLEEDDTVAIVVYAGAAGTVLEPTVVSEKRKIQSALNRLRAGGSTAGGQGLERAYDWAEDAFDPDAVNRVILATDGDFNVGVSSVDALRRMIVQKRKSGIYLSVLGFGAGNLNDHLMQALAQNGNGVAAHIDNLNEARKVLVEEASSTLFTIAKDVKIQVEFNPGKVAEYRLIGYETRALKREDFRNDKIDAGDIGAGHSVTAIYEISPVGSNSRMLPDNRYTRTTEKPKSSFGDEYAFLKIRYKLPGEDKSRLITEPIRTTQEARDIDTPGYRDTRWATAVAAFGQLLKGGKYMKDFDYDQVIDLARSAKGEDDFGYRAEFINLARIARSTKPLN